ncbi:MAG TPA: cellulase family glycosylhydrolase [Capsulimonadaceae bacterium]|nr:cellulase family glycosylhydrolase [Capsulimonadaceae bacterium]
MKFSLIIAGCSLAAATILFSASVGAPADPPATALPLAVELAGSTVVHPGPLSERLKLTNSQGKPLAVSVEYSLQHDPALYDTAPPDPVYGSDRALGAPSWTVADGQVIERGSLTDGKSWTGASTDYITKHWSEAYQYIDLGKPLPILKMTWLSGDANWVDKVDVSSSLDGKTYTPVPSLENIEVYKKWGTNDFGVAQPFTARFLQFRYHNEPGVLSDVIRMPSTISVYCGTSGESMDLPSVGRMAAQGKLAPVVPAGGNISIPLTTKIKLAAGDYLLGVKAQTAGRTYLSWEHIQVTPAPIKTSTKSRFGIDAADPKLIGSLQQLGVGWVRFENMKWPFVSNVPGQFHFDGSLAPWNVDEDAIAADYRAHGINILPFLFLTQNYETPPGTAPPANELTDPPKDFNAYANFVYQTVARYGGTKHKPTDLESADKKSGLGLIHVFELWNEPNLNNPDWGEWKGSLPQYYDLFHLGAQAIKKADPTALISNGGFSGIGLQLVDSLRTYKYPDGTCPLDYMNVLNVHYYTGQSAPEEARINANTGTFGSKDTRTFEQNLKLLSDWRDRYKPGMPIWLTETGYETNDFGVDERTQAAWLVRDVLLCLASGVEKVFVFRESGSDQGRWAGAGVLRTNGSPKPSFFTYAALIRQMQGVEGGALPIATKDPNIRIYAWKQAGQPMLTAWAIHGEATFPLNLGKASVADSFGDRQENVDTSRLRLSIFPVFLRGCSNKAQLSALLAAAAHVKAERKATLREENDLKSYLFGFGSKTDVGGFVIGDGYRLSTPVLAQETYDESRGYGFSPTPALQDDNTFGNDPYNQHSCRLAKGIQFRFRAGPGRYVLNVGVQPFSATGVMTIRGAVGGVKAVTVTKAKGQVEVPVQVAAGQPLSIEMDGYAALRWLNLVQALPVKK